MAKAPVTISDADVEAISTGDYDFGKSKVFKRMYAEMEDLPKKKGAFVDIVIRIKRSDA